MAFSSETKIFTSKGWKLIKNISGHDRVLVRNFLGEAEFIQPFALKKHAYTGEIITFGATYWAVSVTPEHKVVYANDTSVARDVSVDRHRKLHRKFRYIREDKTNESITLKNGDTDRRVSLSDEDWYTLVAYTVAKGFISKDKNPRLKFFLNMQTILPVISVLDKLGIRWSSIQNETSIVVTVNRDNNLPRKLKLFLGARARRDMKLPDKMLYGLSQSLMKHFLGTYASLVASPSKHRPNQLIFASTNSNLVESLRLMCMIVGYGFSTAETHGEFIIAMIPGEVSPWSVRAIEKRMYSGDVYEIDLFDGLVYVTERNLPVWMSPK